MIETKLEELLQKLDKLDKNNFFMEYVFTIGNPNQHFIARIYTTNQYLDETFWGEKPVDKSIINVTRQITQSFDAKGQFKCNIYRIKISACEKFSYFGDYYERNNKGDSTIKKMYNLLNSKYRAYFKDEEDKFENK